ncbi:MAG: hypothetical protein LIO79_10180 [Rikenellaceae bacterium]|nr:hypothetical protein [Rikenellaceae bacterium]
MEKVCPRCGMQFICLHGSVRDLSDDCDENQKKLIQDMTMIAALVNYLVGPEGNNGCLPLAVAPSGYFDKWM